MNETAKKTLILLSIVPFSIALFVVLIKFNIKNQILIFFGILIAAFWPTALGKILGENVYLGRHGPASLVFQKDYQIYAAAIMLATILVLGITVSLMPSVGVFLVNLILKLFI